MDAALRLAEKDNGRPDGRERSLPFRAPASKLNGARLCARIVSSRLGGLSKTEALRPPARPSAGPSTSHRYQHRYSLRWRLLGGIGVTTIAMLTCCLFVLLVDASATLLFTVSMLLVVLCGLANAVIQARTTPAAAMA